MSLRLVAVSLDAHEPARVAGFWAALLGRDLVPTDDGLLLPGEDAQVGLQFVAATTDKTTPNRMHLHLTSDSPEDQQRTVETVLELGGHHLDVGQRPDEGHVVLADPEGNELCVIEAGNSFLASSGRLGEVACDGTREVGLFWSRALDWPLVWDQDEETAIQSRHGGTKLAWGGPPVAPHVGRSRQRLHLQPAASDADAELERLVGLGATRLTVDVDGDVDGVVALEDPDGTEFSVRRWPPRVSGSPPD